jgi:hypothetical protein
MSLIPASVTIPPKCRSHGRTAFGPAVERLCRKRYPEALCTLNGERGAPGERKGALAAWEGHAARGMGAPGRGRKAQAGRGIPGRASVQRASLVESTRYPVTIERSQRTPTLRRTAQHTRRHSTPFLYAQRVQAQHRALAPYQGTDQRSLPGMRARRTPEGTRTLRGTRKCFPRLFWHPRDTFPSNDVERLLSLPRHDFVPLPG